MNHPSIPKISPVRVGRRHLVALMTAALAFAPPLVAQEKVDVATIERIKSEEMNRSQVMDIMSWLSDVYGPRLTWSPNATRAGDWAMGQMKTWGLANVHEEKWDTPAGLGWENQKFAMTATSPMPFIVEAVPQAWSGRNEGNRQRLRDDGSRRLPR